MGETKFESEYGLGERDMVDEKDGTKRVDTIYHNPVTGEQRRAAVEYIVESADTTTSNRVWETPQPNAVAVPK